MVREVVFLLQSVWTVIYKDSTYASILHKASTPFLQWVFA